MGGVPTEDDGFHRAEWRLAAPVVFCVSDLLRAGSGQASSWRIHLSARLLFLRRIVRDWVVGGGVELRLLLTEGALVILHPVDLTGVL